jgi:cytochrome c-type biogenesis protein CcmH
MSTRHVSGRALALSIGVLALTAVTTALAVDNTPAFNDHALQERYYGLTHEMRCMQCQNEALADSNVSLAADLRLEIHNLLQAGKSDEEIRDYMVARYSEFILFKPRMSLRNAWLWAAPGVMLILGVMIALRIMRQRAQLPIDDDIRAESR